jgi:hypothetical protein
MATRHTYGGSSQHFNGPMEQQGQSAGMMGQVKAAGEAVQSQAQHVIEDYPLSTVLAVFGIGLGVGCLLGAALIPSSSSSHSSSWFPSSSSSSWFPSMSTGSSWFPSSSNGSWFSGSTSNWGDNLMRSARNMCGH